MGAAVEDRRRVPRGEFPTQLAVNLVDPQAEISADGVNLSEGGVCLRLQAALEVKSMVRLQVSPDRRAKHGAGKARRPVQCTGRVAWVIQRLDLRSAPPFLFDVGIEFVDPPALLRQMLVRNGIGLAALKELSQQATQKAMPAGRSEPVRVVGTAVIRSRRYLARLDQDPDASVRWHLVVLVDEIPCFSARYTSERAALEGWAQYRRSQARRSGNGG